jgi:hypothetical protein
VGRPGSGAGGAPVSGVKSSAHGRGGGGMATAPPPAASMTSYGSTPPVTMRPGGGEAEPRRADAVARPPPLAAAQRAGRWQLECGASTPDARCGPAGGGPPGAGRPARTSRNIFFLSLSGCRSVPP